MILIIYNKKYNKYYYIIFTNIQYLNVEPLMDSHLIRSYRSFISTKENPHSCVNQKNCRS